MTARLTVFTATLVQDSALSIGGLDREGTSDQPFTIVDGKPVIPGRALKGAAVAMARRFFSPLPAAVSDPPKPRPRNPETRGESPRRSVWEFADATLKQETMPALRAGVGIRQKTGARATGILYDREVIPANTRWKIELRVDWSQALSEEEAREAEGILGYVLAEHWVKERCWLGGGVARGLGWCHLEGLKAYRFDDAQYRQWLEAGRRLDRFASLKDIPTAKPTRSWFFATRDVTIRFGEYRPDPDDAPWGLDMLAVGPHESERTVQKTVDPKKWAKPSWAENGQMPAEFETDRAILMEGDHPLLPGSSVRGPLRHAFSRLRRAAGDKVLDPHVEHGNVPESDPAAVIFGTVSKSSRVLIRDARAAGDWYAARLHMHAEDEFSAGSYGSAKRDAVRLLKGEFPVRIVIEGGDENDVERLVRDIDRQIALGALGHLPIGGHKTRGAGWGRWEAKPWDRERVQGEPRDVSAMARREGPTRKDNVARSWDFFAASNPEDTFIRTREGTLSAPLTLAEAARQAGKELGDRSLVAWWCDPTIDVTRKDPPETFGREWPNEDLRVDEVAFYAEKAVWRAVRTRRGVEWVLIEEVASHDHGDALKVEAHFVPARLHGFSRFAEAKIQVGKVLLREWHLGGEVLGFTMTKEEG